MRITLVLLILMGTTVLQIHAVYALASAWQVVTTTASPGSARWGLGAACVIREMPTRPVELETCMLWAAVMFYYYFNILTKFFDRNKMSSDSPSGSPTGNMPRVGPGLGTEWQKARDRHGHAARVFYTASWCATYFTATSLDRLIAMRVCG